MIDNACHSIISSDILYQQLSSPAWRIIDCRFNLKDPGEGWALYKMGHIPNAIYAHLENDLSSKVTAYSGRHPLPDAKSFQQTLGKWNIKPETQIIVYDDSAGSYAARLWWMLRWMGHESVAVLDGGFSHWRKQGLPLVIGEPTGGEISNYVGSPSMSMLIDSDSLEKRLLENKCLLIDVRDSIRFKGIEEPVDKIAGHIPGAINLPWKTNIGEDGLFLSKASLHDYYSKVLRNKPVTDTVFMCGSGVTACHSLLVLDYLGIKGAKLYPGSWSAWISDSSRPVTSLKAT